MSQDLLITAQQAMQANNIDYALACLREIIKLHPQHAAAQSGIGQILHRKGELETALIHYKLAVKYQPVADNWLLLAKALHRFGDYAAAQLAYQQALALQPNNPEIIFSFSLLQLLQGDYINGWLGYEARWQLAERGFAMPVTRKPRWQGEDLSNSCLLIICEQGLGDSIQFLRYIKLIKAKKIILQVQSSLISLVKHSFAAIKILPDNAPVLDSYDYYIHLGSLGGKFVNIPDNVPYLYADKTKIESWREKLTPDKINIGIVWRGNPGHVNDHNRSCSWEYFLPLATWPKLKLYSLQLEQELAANTGIINLAPELKNFHDTAALIQTMDLIISVDTATAHLTGALGQKLWLILPYVPDWRWLLDRADSPWYPTARLFRQPRAQDWNTVFTQLQDELIKQ